MIINLIDILCFLWKRWYSAVWNHAAKITLEGTTQSLSVIWRKYSIWYIGRWPWKLKCTHLIGYGKEKKSIPLTSLIINPLKEIFSPNRLRNFGWKKRTRVFDPLWVFFQFAECLNQYNRRANTIGFNPYKSNYTFWSYLMEHL